MTASKLALEERDLKDKLQEARGTLGVVRLRALETIHVVDVVFDKILNAAFEDVPDSQKLKHQIIAVRDKTQKILAEKEKKYEDCLLYPTSKEQAEELLQQVKNAQKERLEQTEIISIVLTSLHEGLASFELNGPQAAIMDDNEKNLARAKTRAQEKFDTLMVAINEFTRNESSRAIKILAEVQPILSKVIELDKQLNAKQRELARQQAEEIAQQAAEEEKESKTAVTFFTPKETLKEEPAIENEARQMLAQEILNVMNFYANKYPQGESPQALKDAIIKIKGLLDKNISFTSTATSFCTMINEMQNSPKNSTSGQNSPSSEQSALLSQCISVVNKRLDTAVNALRTPKPASSYMKQVMINEINEYILKITNKKSGWQKTDYKGSSSKGYIKAATTILLYMEHDLARYDESIRPKEPKPSLDEFNQAATVLNTPRKSKKALSFISLKNTPTGTKVGRLVLMYQQEIMPRIPEVSPPSRPGLTQR